MHYNPRKRQGQMDYFIGWCPHQPKSTYYLIRRWGLLLRLIRPIKFVNLGYALQPLQAPGADGLFASLFLHRHQARYKHLLANDDFKMMVIESWKYLIAKKKIKIYVFVSSTNKCNK